MDRKHLRVQDLTFIIDTREKKPLDFFYQIDTDKGSESRRVVSERQTLVTGDYSLLGFQKSEICVERKSLDDLLGCVGNQRQRFDREIYRMLAFRARLVVVEASWDDILKGDWRSMLTPTQVVGSIAGWMDLGIPFFFHKDRKVIADFVGNFMWIHASRFHRLAMECHPTQFRMPR